MSEKKLNPDVFNQNKKVVVVIATCPCEVVIVGVLGTCKYFVNIQRAWKARNVDFNAYHKNLL